MIYCPGAERSIWAMRAFSKVQRINDSGEVAFQANGGNVAQRGVYRAGANNIAKIAREGEAVPGGGYFHFPDADIPTPINNAHEVAFATSFSSTVGGAPTGYGVFRGDGTTLVSIARVGQATPQGPAFTQIYDNVDINDSGDVAFHAASGPGGTNPSVYRGNGLSLVAIYTLNTTGPFGSTMGTSIESLAPKNQ